MEVGIGNKQKKEVIINTMIFVLLALMNTYFVLFTFQRHFLYTHKRIMKDVEVYQTLKTTDKRFVDTYVIENGRDIDLIYCHGSRISLYVHKKIFTTLGSMKNCNVITFICRGITRKGPKSESGMIKDMDAVVDMVKKRNKKVILFGQSLGCSSALYMANKLSAIKIILENPFTSIKDIVSDYILGWTVTPIIIDEWNNIPRISRVADIPTLFLISEKDQLIVSDKHIKKFMEICKHPEVVTLLGSNHYNGYKNANFIKNIDEYINK